ncbi:hypothetical protein GUITHDRAFT_142570 [Guillardia theta CCMP2712]|uniref:GOST seven transmembrane domain-containing protein n=1 Tax=Guillardia theta (strain CCMP2712) TaxID=905079 RepID=L1IXU4_GUITC|nr:hypothetical protein GUITHDRAFT_142570 [Guillardia theta CCMP2712]EKX40699.1 hypothetical protein GUITHDRAFT_142570 [Guillardia theta CCMP2712]|eukprot:XP_005827679.1 hypothetical protein GUITHDRAFT_142570 [Guillardia theta CCMP2712]
MVGRMSWAMIATMAISLARGTEVEMAAEGEQRRRFLILPFCFERGGRVNLKVTNIFIKDQRGHLVNMTSDGKSMQAAKQTNILVKGRELSVTAENPNHNQLSAGDAPLPICFFLSSCLFFLALLVWGAVLWVYRDNVQPIQCFMAMTCLVKVSVCRGPLAMSRFPHKVVVNTAVVMVEELPSSQSGWETWRDVLQLADIMCCFGVLMSIVWSIRQLNEVGEADGKTQDNVKKLKLFRRFYMIVLGYIYLTRIFVVMMGTLLACRYTWVCTVVEEFATLCLFVWIGHAFRPTHNNPYLQIPSETEMQSNNNA